MFNILYLISYHTYSHKMSRVRFHGIEEIAKLTNLIYSGHKWPDYNSELPVQENIDILEKKHNIKFDLVICYNPFEKLIDFAKIKRPKCLRYNEMCETYKISREIVAINPDLVICHYKQYVSKFQDMLKDKITTKFYHIPHSAKSSIFKPYPEIEKTIDFLLCGCINKKLYSLRHRFMTKILPILKERGYRCKIMKHAGYKINAAHTDQEPIRFAKLINSTKICLSCSSIYKYKLAKFSEIPMSGSVLCSDLPDQDQDELSEYIIVVDSGMTDEQITDKLVSHISDPEKMTKLRARGLEISQKYTQQTYAKRFIEILRCFTFSDQK